jgi:hypothetical protein
VAGSTKFVVSNQWLTVGLICGGIAPEILFAGIAVPFAGAEVKSPVRTTAVGNGE